MIAGLIKISPHLIQRDEKTVFQLHAFSERRLEGDYWVTRDEWATTPGFTAGSIRIFHRSYKTCMSPSAWEEVDEIDAVSLGRAPVHAAHPRRATYPEGSPVQ